MSSRRKRSLESTGNELIPKPAPSNFLSNLCKFHISQSDLREFSHNFVNKLLIPELLKCTKLPAPKQKQATKVKNERAQPVATRKSNQIKLAKKPWEQTKVMQKPMDQTIVPGYRISQCIDISTRLSASSRRPSKVEQAAKANISLNKNRREPSVARPKTAPSKSSPSVKSAAANEKTKFTKQISNEMISDAVNDSSLVRAIDVRNGDLMISEIIIKFCRNDNE